MVAPDMLGYALTRASDRLGDGAFPLLSTSARSPRQPTGGAAHHSTRQYTPANALLTRRKSKTDYVANPFKAVCQRMTPDQERWAEALQIERMYGDRAPVWIVERIGALALAGDEAGVQRFREIAARFEAVMAERRKPIVD